jgi:hypothetical protein
MADYLILVTKFDIVSTLLGGDDSKANRVVSYYKTARLFNINLAVTGFGLSDL